MGQNQPKWCLVPCWEWFSRVFYGVFSRVFCRICCRVFLGFLGFGYLFGDGKAACGLLQRPRYGMFSRVLGFCPVAIAGSISSEPMMEIVLGTVHCLSSKGRSSWNF